MSLIKRRKNEIDNKKHHHTFTDKLIYIPSPCLCLPSFRLLLDPLTFALFVNLSDIFECQISKIFFRFIIKFTLNKINFLAQE